MLVYRLSRRKFAKRLSGKGASLSGNRWNSKGTEIIYCSESRALAMAEIAVHLTLGTLPRDFVMLEILIAENISMEILEKENLPAGWNTFPHILLTQKIGDTFINTNKSCILKVPSAVVKGDFNYLINPHHPEFSKIQISHADDFPFDKRFFE